MLQETKDEIHGVGKGAIEKLLKKYEPNDIRKLSEKELSECIGDVRADKIARYYASKPKHYFKNDKTVEYFNSKYLARQ